MGKSTLTAEERKALYRMFADYREYKTAIASRSMPTRRGFASAIHPDLIRRSRVYPPGPVGASGIRVTPGFSDAAYRRYIDRIDRQVKRLPPYQRSIIRKRFLCRGPLPTDGEVHAELRAEGWYVSKRYFDEEKGAGLQTLFMHLKSDKISDASEVLKTQ